MLTLGQAAKQVGKTKTTLANAIKRGRLSARIDDNGHYQIDPAELFRVYSPADRPSIDQQKTTVDPNTEGLLRQQISMLQTQLDAAQERERRLLGIIEQQARLLAHDKQNEAQQAPQSLTELGLARWVKRMIG